MTKAIKNFWNATLGWPQAGGKYYVSRNGSSLIAFQVGTELRSYSFNIAASHSDSPTFKVKESAEINVSDICIKLNVEGYGNMICSTWLDRPLSIAGRIWMRKNDGKLSPVLVNLDRDLVLIPSVAIHLNRSVKQLLEKFYCSRFDALIGN